MSNLKTFYLQFVYPLKKYFYRQFNQKNEHIYLKKKVLPLAYEYFFTNAKPYPLLLKNYKTLQNKTTLTGVIAVAPFPPCFPFQAGTKEGSASRSGIWVAVKKEQSGIILF